jgi:hypothetical protein
MKIKRQDEVLKGMLVVFFVVLVGNTVEYFFLHNHNLKRVDGIVSEIEVKTYECPGGKYWKATCEKTTIKLKNIKGVFGVSDYFDRGAYIDVIEKGDTVTIYIRKWYQYILTLGAGKDINGLELNGIVYYDIWRWKASNKAFMMLFSILFLFFGGLYIMQRATMNQLANGKSI